MIPQFKRDAQWETVDRAELTAGSDGGRAATGRVDDLRICMQPDSRNLGRYSRLDVEADQKCDDVVASGQK